MHADLVKQFLESCFNRNFKFVHLQELALLLTVKKTFDVQQEGLKEADFSNFFFTLGFFLRAYYRTMPNVYNKSA